MDTFLSLLWILFCAIFFAGAIIKNIQKEDTPESIGWVMIVAVSMFGLILLIGCIMNSSIFDNFGMEKVGQPRSGKVGPVHGAKTEKLPPGWSWGKNKKYKVKVGDKEMEFDKRYDAEKWERQERRQQRSNNIQAFLRGEKINDPALEKNMQAAQHNVDALLRNDNLQDPNNPWNKYVDVQGTIRLTTPEEIAVAKTKASEFLLLGSGENNLMIAVKDGKAVRLNTPEADAYMRKYPKAKYFNPEVKAQAEKMRNEPAQPPQETPKSESGKLDPANGVPGIKSEPGPSSSKPVSSRPFAGQSLESLEFAREEVEHRIQMQTLLHERGFTGKNPETEVLKMQRDQLDREISRRKDTEELWRSPRIPPEMRKYRRDLQKIISTEEDLVSKGFKPDPEVEKYRQELATLNDNVGSVVAQLPVGRELMPIPTAGPKESPGLFDRWLKGRTGGSLFEKLPGETKKPGQLSAEESSKNTPLSEVADEVSHFDPLRGVRKYEEPDRDPRLAGGPKEPWEDVDPAVNVWNEIMSQKGTRQGKERKRQEKWLRDKGGEPTDTEPLDSRENAVFHEYGEDGTGLNPNGETSGQLKRRSGFDMKGVDSHFSERRQRPQAAEETEPAKEVGPEEASQSPLWSLLFGHDPYNPSGLIGNERAPLSVENAGKAGAKTKSQVSEQSPERVRTPQESEAETRRQLARAEKVLSDVKAMQSLGLGNDLDVIAWEQRVKELREKLPPEAQEPAAESNWGSEFKPEEGVPGIQGKRRYLSRAEEIEDLREQRRLAQTPEEIAAINTRLEQLHEHIPEWNAEINFPEYTPRLVPKFDVVTPLLQRLQAVDKTVTARNALAEAKKTYDYRIRTLASDLESGKATMTEIASRLDAAEIDLQKARQVYSDAIKDLEAKPENAGIPFESVTTPDTTTFKPINAEELIRRYDDKNVQLNHGVLELELTPEQAVSMFQKDPTGASAVSKGAQIVEHDGKLYLQVTPDAGTPIMDATHPLHAYNGKAIAGSDYASQQLDTLQRLRAKKAIAETAGDTATAERLGKQIEATEKTFSENADKAVAAYDKLLSTRLQDFENKKLTPFRTTQESRYGVLITPEEYKQLREYFSPKELQARGLYFSEAPVGMGGAGGYYLTPEFVTPEGMAAKPGEPGLRNRGDMYWRDHNGVTYTNLNPADVSTQALLDAGIIEPVKGRTGTYTIKDQGLADIAAYSDPAHTAKVVGSTAAKTVTVPGKFIGNHLGSIATAGALTTGGIYTAGLLNETSEAYRQKKEEARQNALKNNKILNDPVALEEYQKGFCKANELPLTEENKALATTVLEHDIVDTAENAFDRANGLTDVPGLLATNAREGASNIVDAAAENVGLKAPKPDFTQFNRPETKHKVPAKKTVKTETDTNKDVPEPWSLDKALANAKKFEASHFGEGFAQLPVSHTLTGAGLGTVAGGTAGALRYLLGSTSQLSEEEKKRRTLMRMVLSNAGIGAGLGATMGGIADIRQDFFPPGK